jgi:hypothetical protein
MDMLGSYIDQLPPESAGPARAMLGSTRYWDSFIPDAMLGESAAALLSSSEQRATTPLIVLSAGQPDTAFPPANRARFTALHEQIARTLSRRGEHRLVAGADHYSMSRAARMPR